MSNKLDEYMNTLTLTNRDLSELIDVSKISRNVDDLLIELNQLNYIISKDEDEIIRRISILYDKYQSLFKILPIIIGTKDENLHIKSNGNTTSINELCSSKEGVIKIFKETNIIEFIKLGYISNFVDYVTGVEVGMDTNARKNRGGVKEENNIENKLKNLFKDRKEIKIHTQKKINVEDEILSVKVFDIVIENIESNKKILIESSFYNAGGSKINETSKSFKKINELISNYPNFKFIWLADGKGMQTIKKILSTIIEDDFLMNQNQFFKNIKKMI